MKDFRNELLAELYANSGEDVNTKPLYDKYCTDITVFPLAEQDKYIKCRLRINTVLKELKEIGWITYYPIDGYGTCTNYNPYHQMRQFIATQSVFARLTMLGELEYKKTQEVKEPNKTTIQIGGNFQGILTGGNAANQSYLDLDTHLPAETPQAKTKSIRNTIKSFGKWMLENIWKIFLSLVAAYIAIRIGLKK